METSEAPVEVKTLKIGRDQATIEEKQIVIDAAAEMPQYGAMGPGPTTPVVMHVYVTDADAVFNRAVAAGATVVTPLSDMFWGDRYGKLRDPFGHEWSIATHKEDVPPDQMAERMKKAFGAC